MQAHQAQTAARLLPDDDSLRALYRVLRQRERMESSVQVLAAEARMTESQVRCGMQVFAQLGLMTYTWDPLRYQLRRSGRVSLEDSALRGRLIRMKG